MSDRLDKLESRLAWRVGLEWTPVTLGDRRGLEATDGQGRLYWLFPEWVTSADGTAMWCSGVVKFVGQAHYQLEGVAVDTWGQTPEQAVERGGERLVARLETLAREHDVEMPRLAGGASTGAPERGDELSESGDESGEFAFEKKQEQLI